MRYECVAIAYLDDEVKTVVLTEWWFEGKLVESIEESAKHYFYDAFDKSPFKVVSIEKVVKQRRDKCLI